MSKEHKQLIDEYRILNAYLNNLEKRSPESGNLGNALKERIVQIKKEFKNSIAELSISEFREVLEASFFTIAELTALQQNGKLTDELLDVKVTTTNDFTFPLREALYLESEIKTSTEDLALEGKVKDIIELINEENYDLMANVLIEIMEQNKGKVSTIMCELLTRGYRAKGKSVERAIKAVHERCRCQITGEHYVEPSTVNVETAAPQQERQISLMLDRLAASEEDQQVFLQTAENIKKLLFNTLASQPDLITKEDIERSFYLGVLQENDIIELISNNLLTENVLDAEISFIVEREINGKQIADYFNGSILEYLFFVNQSFTVQTETEMQDLSTREFIETYFPGIYALDVVQELASQKEQKGTNIENLVINYAIKAQNNSATKDQKTQIKADIASALLDRQMTSYALNSALFCGAIDSSDLIDWAQRGMLTEELLNTKFNVQDLAIEGEKLPEPKVITLYQYLKENTVLIANSIAFEEWAKDKNFDIVESVKSKDINLQKQQEAEAYLDHALKFVEKHPRIAKIALDQMAKYKEFGIDSPAPCLDHLTTMKYDKSQNFMENGGKHLVKHHQKESTNFFVKMWNAVANFCIMASHGGAIHKSKGIANIMFDFEKHMQKFDAKTQTTEKDIKTTPEDCEKTLTVENAAQTMQESRAANYKNSTLSEEAKKDISKQLAVEVQSRFSR